MIRIDRRPSHGAANRLPLLRALLWFALCWAAQAGASSLSLGPDIPYSVIEEEGPWSVEEARARLFAQPLPEREVFARGYRSPAFWLRFELPAAAFDAQDRWLQLRPGFVDEIHLYYRPLGSQDAWVERRTGDTYAGPIGDFDYRLPVFVIPPEARGYEMLARVASTSTLVLELELWQPEAFTRQAMGTTSFWSFYFGLATLSSLLALVLACILRTRLLWSVAAMSAPYLLVACIQGYVGWVIGDGGRLLQHYLTSATTLLSYASLLWMTAECLGLRKRLPWAYRMLMIAAGGITLLLPGIPLGLYGEAVWIQTMVYLFGSGLCLMAGAYLWWRDRPPFVTLLLGASPLVCILASLCGMGSAFGWFPFRQQIYLIWQYAIMVNMLLVTAIAVFQVRDRRLQEVEKVQLARELRLEREARHHQRQFMGLVAHEFRTPLAIISASLENLRLTTPADSGQAVRYGRIGRATDRLVQLTDNCLADARLDAGTLFIARKPTDLIELVGSAASLVQLSDHYRWALRLDGEPVSPASGADAQAEVDSALMRIALSNVIDNAVKYSPQGTILVELDQQPGHWTIAVSDSGPGIDAALVEVIFERYRQANDTERGERGVGLGLYVSRQIARGHGGDLRLVENSAKGCRFVFTLPHHQAATGTP